ncbi:hypothetical protein C1645_813582 [Glomus cerebriforme]|uniref:F-box domain-containing protein n=1 Tax=Glomus cerebriforme TaxID=658196 RepID=A0A397TSJ0_9GLOM|nr:hypothetical protein C1645_813582 [Glomus cerebriforme]
MSQLLADCLNEIFEYLENDMITLQSCLLVNRLWCEISVKIFWRDVRNYRDSNYHTLISCLPNESKEILHKNGINISTPTSKPPTFNYASFCKVLPVNQIPYKLEQILKNQQNISLHNLYKNVFIVAQEIFKLYMDQIISLKELEFWKYLNVNFNLYPGAKDCLKNLSKLSCCSDIPSEFFYKLSKICHNLLSIDILVEQDISKGLTDLISAQKNLKNLTIRNYRDGPHGSLKDIIPSFTKPNNLSKLCLYGIQHTSFSFIAEFTNLQVLEISFHYNEEFKDFEKLQFPQLQILKFKNFPLKYEILIKFLEHNGKNLRELYINEDYGYSNNTLNLAIAKFCPNLRKISTWF